jgi:hypothetical protein
LQIYDKNGKLSQSAMWLSVFALMIISAPIWIVYDHFGYMTQGMFAVVSNAILWLYALQFPQYLKRPWFYVILVCLSIFYFTAGFLMPGGLPKNSPTSFFLWPFALVTIGIDRLVIKFFARRFEE